MESSGSSRSGLLTAGGILSIVAGTFQIIGGVQLVVLLELGMRLVPLPLQSGPDLWGKGIVELELIPKSPSQFWLWITVVLIILGIIAIGGGVSAIKRRSFGLSLAGAICALPFAILGWYLFASGLSEVVFFLPLALVICGLASVSLGILAIIFVALGKREFGAKVKEDDI